MYTHGASAGLPNEGESVEFVLDGRKVAIAGTYARRLFRSRWSGYGVERVSSWRSADVESSAAASEHNTDSGNIRQRDPCPR